MQYQFIETSTKKTKTKKKTKTNISRIDVNQTLETLNILQLYEKQQKNDKVKIIKQLDLYRRTIKCRKTFNNNKATLDR